MSQQRPEPSGPPPQPTGQPPGHQSQGSRPQQPYRTQPGPPPPGYQPSGYPPVGAPLSRSDENLWALLAHLSIPFVGFVGPLVVHLVFKGRSPWLEENALEALNFSILYTIAVSACGLLSVVVIGALLLPVVVIGAFVLAVLGAVAANRHELYRYPVNWRLVR